MNSSQLPDEELSVADLIRLREMVREAAQRSEDRLAKIESLIAEKLTRPPGPADPASDGRPGARAGQ
jgi:hypothetical protein